jgi:IQ calmodulin-binding motif
VVSLLEQEISAIVLQCMWRRQLAHRRYVARVLHHQAVITIQNFWRLTQLQDSTKNAAAIQIQRRFRGYWCRFQFIIDVLDIIAVQSCARRLLAKQRYQRLAAAVIALQCAGRCFLARISLGEKRLSALCLIAAV